MELVQKGTKKLGGVHIWALYIRKAGQVFDNHAVDPAAIHIGQEPLEIFTVGIRPGFAVIHIHILLGSVIKLVQMGLVVLFQKPPLVDNAVAFVPATE